jgi:hypothetical protein
MHVVGFVTLAWSQVDLWPAMQYGAVPHGGPGIMMASFQLWMASTVCYWCCYCLNSHCHAASLQLKLS